MVNLIGIGVFTIFIHSLMGYSLILWILQTVTGHPGASTTSKDWWWGLPHPWGRRNWVKGTLALTLWTPDWTDHGDGCPFTPGPCHFSDRIWARGRNNGASEKWYGPKGGRRGGARAPYRRSYFPSGVKGQMWDMFQRPCCRCLHILNNAPPPVKEK